MTTKNIEAGGVNPDALLKRTGLDNKSQRLLLKSMEGLSKSKRLEILQQQFPQLFGNSQLGQEPMPSASD